MIFSTTLCGTAPAVIGAAIFLISILRLSIGAFHGINGGSVVEMVDFNTVSLY